MIILYIWLWLFPLLVPEEKKDANALANHYSEKAKKYLVKDSQVHNFFRIDQRGVAMFASFRDKQLNKPEFFLAWSELEDFKKLIKYADRSYQFELYRAKGTSPFDQSMLMTINILEQNHYFVPVSRDLPLSGLRIAIDPGHIAGDLDVAKEEGRFVNMKGPGGKEYSFFEGELNLATAFVLRDSLEKMGAEVMMTRHKGNYSALGISFDHWKETKLPEAMKKAGVANSQLKNQLKNTSASMLYRMYFLRADLDARADKINYFKPHFTVVIHYNADEKNVGWKKPSKRNFSMVFVPGAYMKHELKTSLDRFDFIRILLSDHIQESVNLSEKVMGEFKTYLKVPPVSTSEEPSYLKVTSLRINEGVYARNLRLCRLLNTPICYAEPLLQDNEHELKALDKNNLQKGQIAPRVVQVANSYYRGIMRYVAERRKRQNFLDQY
ncbi:N-acetylmuramoyl-L-alanine amidase [Rapidithrix thailandica]|uniref:N-acetylmuramoyl-L-alanine amidase n=1 Tax=Rapidithrix thailandica TaxID=413964 RepID=A0AAW9S2S7_9BACT